MVRYLVELAYRYYMCLGYSVRIAVPIPYTKRVGGVEKKFYQFIDVLALKSDEAIVAECRDFRNVKKVRDSLARLCKLFELALKALEPELCGRVRKLILIVEDRDLSKIEPYRKLLDSRGISVLKLSEIIPVLIECSLREEEYRKARGEGDLILAVIRAIHRYYTSILR